MAKTVLLVTWIVFGQPPSSYQVTFDSAEACDKAREAVLSDGMRLGSFALTVSLEANTPPTVLWGGALYLPTLLTIVAAAIALKRRNSAAGNALLS